ncbi:LamG-like jellyroll fold domain-containing protein [uncultured Algibacter sp.]|uniref:LamG-like jellyroll fold domain-containing protein n=1 Tax=uncultured Algibacter sp. TaxID=298659 RepID=UPI0026278511|nr:LamG-like jellyroll fold domain-containing protein [uncultured Algibacter sp.]
MRQYIPPTLFQKNVFVFFIFIGLNYTLFSQTADFKVQHIQDEVGNTGETNTSFTAVNSLNSVVELANSNRKTHGGPQTHSGNRPGDDMAGARQLTAAGTLTYYRESSSDSRDMRFNTSIWEYIGASGGDNELIVRGRYAVNLNGSTNSVAQAIAGVINANKCIPFVTGIMNSATSQDADSATAVAYLEDATTLRVQKGSNGNNVTVYITLVEFTGINWTVLHGDSGNSSADSGTITLNDGADGTGTATNVSDWSEAIIFSHFRADTGASGVNDAISDLWPVTDPGSNNQSVDWTFHSNHDSAGTNRHFIHVLTNTGLNVVRFQNTSRNAGETAIDITSAGLSDIHQALIVGSSSSSGRGTAYGRGWRNYYLNSTTEAVHWAHRNNNTLSHEIQIIDLSGLQTTFTGPEINVKGNGVNIPDGNTAISLVDDTDFGQLVVTGTASESHTFTIHNQGTSDLTLDSASPYVVITGATADFTLTANPSTPITSGGSTTFTITYDPITAGSHTATVSIANNDTDENPYTFLIFGRGEYCGGAGDLTFDTSVTYVAFNTLSNADNEIPKDNPFEDFTSMSTNVYRNATHNFTVRVNTDGNNTVYTNVWMDWNNDGDFDDPGEEYDMGSATNVSDGATTNSPLAITIPSDAEIGSTGMRVGTKISAYPTSCESGFNGEVEDYSINVVDYLIDFDGVNEFIDVGDNHDLTSSFSLEAWVLQELAVAQGTIISNGNIDATLQTGYHLSIQSGYPNLTWYDNSNNEIINITSPYLIPNNEWHHIAATYDGVDAKLYIDGIEVVSGATVTAPSSTVQSFKIGAETVNYATTPLQANFFDGAIQEVRVWDVSLSEDQIREMMNQHIEQNGTSIKGSTVPLDISGGLLWSNLLGYYPLDSNTAFDSSDYSVDGTPMNIKLIQSVSAPLPYETDGDSDWDASTTWLNGDDVYIPNSIGVDASTTIDWNIVELTNDVSSGDRDITLNSLVTIAGTLTIANPTEFLDEANSGHSLTVSNYLELDGIIDLVGESQLVQTEGSVLDASSGGYIERDQQGTANGYNYNYWSSSVSHLGGDVDVRGTGIAATNANYTISGEINDGSLSAFYQDLLFSDDVDGSGSIPPPGFAKTISTAWLYKFYGESDNYYAWNKIDESTPILPGEGFTMKGTSGSIPISTKQNYVFTGLPFNGDITLELDNTSLEIARLIGNPYPSAIDATEFILDNMSIADGGNNTTGTIFNGALYFWDHFGEQNSHVLKDYVGGYSTRNLIGGAIAISNDSRIDDNMAAGTKIPGQYIPVNQGFFVSTALDGFDNDNGMPIATVDGGDIVFKNSQRVFAREDGSASIFVRPSNAKKESTTSNNEDNTPKIKLKYISPKGYHRQIVLGANENASESFDIGYDAFMIDVGEEDMYWYFANSKFVIQGVNKFEDTQEFPLGLIVKEAGIIKINLDELENINKNMAVYIRDYVTNETYNIKNNSFELFLEPGNYNDRFALVFNSASLDVEENNGPIADIRVYYIKESSQLKITNKKNIHLSSIDLYNILGQNITSIKLNSTKDESIKLNVSAGAYIVKIKTEKGNLSKKIITE